MHLVSLAVSDFRNIEEVSFQPAPTGTTVVTGPNGAGKTSLLEAIGYLATLQSFRGVPREAMIRSGAERAIVRGAAVAGDRMVEVEAEINASGRSRTLVNRQRVERRADLDDALRVTLFSPEDIAVVRGGPSGRRRFLDDLLAAVDPRVAPVVDEVDKTIRQRTALLRRAGGRLGPDLAATLDVWDARLDQAGALLADYRSALTERLTTLVSVHHARLSGRETAVDLRYRRTWDGSLLAALLASRPGDLARGMTLVGPHRDDLDISLAGLPARTQASQGEQRTLALALRLAAHELVTTRAGSPPVLLLDDVFSELDPSRAGALLAGLGDGQAILTTAMAPPAGVAVSRTVVMARGGRIEAAGDHSPVGGPR
jgi:DNA replication and repair protein RecF